MTEFLRILQGLYGDKSKTHCDCFYCVVVTQHNILIKRGDSTTNYDNG